MRLQPAFLLLLSLTACRTEPDSKVDDTGPSPVDLDADGYDSSVDCDDSDASVHPDAEEACNGVDDDCDGEVDEELSATWFTDADGDGFGDSATATERCEGGDGLVADATDCDDGDASIYPGAEELCDGIDQDCDAEVDEGVVPTWYADADGDGYGDPESVTEACDPGEGWVEVDGDCDDTDPAFHPGAAEDDCTDPNDYNCDGSVGYADEDGDGYAACAECDDSDPTVNPGATELCNGVDDDCDGTSDEDDAADAAAWYADADGDTYGDASAIAMACEQPSGFVADATDCDDAEPTVNPGATELCNEVDDDCDGAVDEDDAADALIWYADGDGDTYGDVSTTAVACAQPSGFVADATDCDDAAPAINPGATELCNTVDDDCDGAVDEDDAADALTWYADADGDTYGDAASSTVACTQPSGFVVDATDCDDAESTVNPGATELCDMVDDDCDGAVYEDDAADALTWYADADGDTYGDASVTAAACAQPSGFVADATDCDDASAVINPGAAELCNTLDDDCDGNVDEADAADALTWYADTDGDTYGDAASSTAACAQPSGFVADATDCDDTRASVNPGATELCDGLDGDCDGTIDEDDAADAPTWYEDADGDGYGDPEATVVTCYQPSSTVADNTDCDDTRAGVNPGATELCDGLDDDCDGAADEDDAADAPTWYADADADGYGDASAAARACTQPSGYLADDNDCDDGDGAVNPGATELCNGVDDDCDGTVDEDDALGAPTWYADADADGYGDAGATSVACSAPGGYVADATDCDDADAGVNPTAAEACNGADDDCDGGIDEGLLGSGAACPAISCAEVLADDPSAADGLYTLEGLTAGTFDTWCDMTSDGGGWTLVGSVVNEGSRSWDSYGVWTDTTTFGAVADRQAADFKSDAFYDVIGDDFLVRTEEYAFAFDALMGDQDVASFLAAEYSTSACSTAFLASGADWSDGLTAAQEAFQSFVVRPWDNNCDCFPGCNEGAMIGMQLAECCWTPGLGNTPAGQVTWSTHDLSLLQLSHINPVACTAGSYPCNGQGYYNPAGYNCYDESCKVTYAEMYVR